jgi:hypothetical protein
MNQKPDDSTRTVGGVKSLEVKSCEARWQEEGCEPVPG